MKKLMLFLMLLFLKNQMYAQDFSAWYSLFGNDKLKNGFNIHYEVQYRNHNVIGRLDQLLLRVGIGYTFSENTQNVLLGYGYIYNKSSICYEVKIPKELRDQFRFGENRFFQQYIMKHQISRILINHRYRFEQRFYDDSLNLRLRYLLSVYLPLNKAYVEKGALYLASYNELFMSTEIEYYDRNRTYLSLGYAFTNFLKVEVGYLRQNISSDVTQHFQISVFNNLDFKMHR